MSTSVNSDQDRDPVEERREENTLLDVLVAFRRSAIFVTAAFGLVLMAIGASPFVSGVFAGMFGVWGATALACAGLGYLGVQTLKLFDA